MPKTPEINPVDQANAKVQKVVEERKKRTQRPFPASPFEESLEFAQAILKFGSGQPVRRLSLFDSLGKSPESGPSRQLIVNANKYGLIEGGYQAEQLKLTPEGVKAADEEIPKRESAKARAKLAIEDIEPFAKLYERFVTNKLPARAALTDAAKEFGIPPELAEEAVDTFIVNLRFVGLLQTLSGAERIVTIDHLLDSLPSSPHQAPLSPAGVMQSLPGRPTGSLVTADHAQLSELAFM